MNWSRGFYRLWLVAAVLWSALALSISWLNEPELVSGTSRLSLNCRYEALVAIDLDDDTMVQWLLETAKEVQSRAGCQGHKGNSQIRTEGVTPPLLSDEEISLALASFHDDQARRPALALEYWAVAVIFALVPPVFILVVGWAVLWALSGFRDTRQG